MLQYEKLSSLHSEMGSSPTCSSTSWFPICWDSLPHVGMSSDRCQWGPSGQPSCPLSTAWWEWQQNKLEKKTLCNVLVSLLYLFSQIFMGLVEYYCITSGALPGSHVKVLFDTTLVIICPLKSPKGCWHRPGSLTLMWENSNKRSTAYSLIMIQNRKTASHGSARCRLAKHRMPCCSATEVVL